MKSARRSLLIAAVYVAILVFTGLPSQGNEKEAAKKKIPNVRVAVLYENITDGEAIGRSKSDTIRLLKETHADMIFRGFWKWSPVVESPDSIPEGLFKLGEDRGLNRKQAAETIRQSGIYYSALETWIAAIKKEIPGILFCGAVPAQMICRIDFNPITGKVYTDEETWKMAFDPQKWSLKRNGRPVTKEEFQAALVRHSGEKTDRYDRKKASAYFPDITNNDFQELLLSWAKKQIDCGADAIWIDMLCAQAKKIVQVTKDIKHPAFKESFAASNRIVDELHKYGKSKGRYIYVGSWGSRPAPGFEPEYFQTDLDFITFSPSIEEVEKKRLDNEKWDPEKIRKINGDIPIFAFIDWSFQQSQTVTFSQELSTDEQKQVLETFDASFSKMGMNFIYPLHGGYMGNGAVTKKLSFGKKRIYDSLAPEFRTYDTIKKLAELKSGTE